MRRQTQRSTAAHATAALAASYHKGRRRSPRLLAVAPAASGEQTRSVAVAAAAASPPRVRARGRPRKVSKPTATTADAVEIDAVASATETEQEVRFPHGTLPRTFEKEKEAAGFRCVVGVDEAGRGPLAGPVVAAACFVPVDVEIVGVHDSKKLSEPQREALYAQLTTHPRVRFAVHVNSAQRIDEINILQASLESMALAVDALPADARADFVFVDGNRLPAALSEGGAAGIQAAPVIKGDSKVFAIAAASIIAKVTRDRLMREYDAQYPQYGLAQHKGYPTAAHVAAIATHGPCAIHRMTFAPLKPKEPKKTRKGTSGADGGKSKKGRA